MVVIQKIVKVISVDNQKVVTSEKRHCLSDNPVTTFGPGFALRVVKKDTVTVTTLTTQKWSMMTSF